MNNAAEGDSEWQLPSVIAEGRRVIANIERTGEKESRDADSQYLVDCVLLTGWW